jgi:hypothetical protein
MVLSKRSSNKMCLDQAFIIQYLDVFTLQLGMKVHFHNFSQTKHTRISVVRR